jgi:hypothetical protein
MISHRSERKRSRDSTAMFHPKTLLQVEADLFVGVTVYAGTDDLKTAHRNAQPARWRLQA